MTDSEDEKKTSSDITVELYRVANRLKAKLGLNPKDKTEGHLDPKAIEEADKLIEALCADCPETIAAHLDDISKLWSQMVKMPESEERAEISVKIYTLSHEIKDIGSMCGYELIAYFAESLRDYIGETTLNLDAQRVIIQAHIDAMTATHRQGAKDDAGPLAEELKKMVKIAIDKYK